MKNVQERRWKKSLNRLDEGHEPDVIDQASHAQLKQVAVCDAGDSHVPWAVPGACVADRECQGQARAWVTPAHPSWRRGFVEGLG
jgi:hypothetical protein